MTTEQKTKSLLRVIEILLGLAGTVLLIWMIHRIGFHVLKENLFRFGLGAMIFLILFYTLSQFAFCAAWYVLLEDPSKKLSFWRTFLAYSAGDALNMTVPSANLAGEPVKVMLLKDRLPTEYLISSVTVYKYADIISMTLFLLLGWLNNFFFYSLPIAWNAGAGIVVAGMAGICFLLYRLQNKGLYHPTGRWLQKIGLSQWIVSKLESAHLVDEGIRTYYKSHADKFFWSILYNFLAWFGGVVEILIFMKLTGLPVSFAAAFTIETFSMFINNVIFFVPARLGVGEGGRVLLFHAMGYASSAGLSYGIVRRIRELAWISLGLAVLVFKKKSYSE